MSVLIMSLVLFCPREAAIRWAVNACEAIDAKGTQMYDWENRRGISIVEKVRQKYGPDYRLDRAEFTAYAALGQYEKALKYAKSVELGKVLLLRKQLGVAQTYEKVFPKRKAFAALPIESDDHRWVVFSYVPAADPDNPYRYAGVKAQVFQLQGGSGSVVGQGFNVGAGSGIGACKTRLEGSRQAWIVRTEEPTMNCSDHTLTVLALQADKLTKVGAINATYDSDVWLNKAGKLTIGAEVTYKVRWPDVYQWNGKRFEFASARHPEYYKDWTFDWKDPDQGRRYLSLLKWSAVSMIRGDSRAALRTLEKARFWCQDGMRPGGAYQWWPGDDREALKEIEKRIQWLKKGDLNHPLLYRPCAWDFQAPPYNL